MKKLAWLLLMIIIAGAVLVYIKPEIITWIREQTGTEPSSTVYKWQDKEGNWHVTDTPPPAGVEYETQEYLHDSNVLPALPKGDD